MTIDMVRLIATFRPWLSFTTARFLIFTLPLKFDLDERLVDDVRRAADVERTHRELRAGLTDRLGGDDADRLADVDRRTAGKIAPVALGAHAVDASRRSSTERMRTSWICAFSMASACLSSISVAVLDDRPHRVTGSLMSSAAVRPRTRAPARR